MGTRPAARMISIGTDGHEMTTPRPSCFASSSASMPAAITDSSNAAVSTAMGIVVIVSNDSVDSQLLNHRPAVSQPFAVNEIIVLADAWGGSQGWCGSIRERDRNAHSHHIRDVTKLRVIERYRFATCLNSRITDSARRRANFRCRHTVSLQKRHQNGCGHCSSESLDVRIQLVNVNHSRVAA